MVTGAESIAHSSQCLHSLPVRSRDARLLRPAIRTGALSRPASRKFSRRLQHQHLCTASKIHQLHVTLPGSTATDTFCVLTAGHSGTADLWTPVQSVALPHVQAAAAPAVVSPGSGYEDHKPRTPPPDLPSLLLDSRITYLGMPVRVVAQHFIYTSRPLAQFMFLAVGASSDRAHHCRAPLSAV